MPEIHDDDASLNPSTHPHFTEVLRAQASRRAVLAGGLASAAGFFATGCGTESTAAVPAKSAAPSPTPTPFPVRDIVRATTSTLLGFTAIARSTEEAIRVPAGYTATPFIPWGTPIVAPYPEFKPGANTAAEQEQQVGMHHDGMHFFPIADARNRTDCWCSTTSTSTRSTCRPASRPARSRRWRPGPRARRAFAGRARCVGRGGRFSGPAAGHRLLKTAADAAGSAPRGTFNPCSNGATPWGTYLTCEENFNQYFRIDGDVAAYPAEAQELLKRYGVGGDKQRWATHDPRFVVTLADPNEPNRFGWIVEFDPFDPFDPASTPIKRTALGRIKHEGACVVEAPGGRIVVYMGDDQVNEFVYKFVSAKPWRSQPAGKSRLDEGTLYVAKFHDDGTGTWLPLVYDSGSLTSANGGGGPHLPGPGQHVAPPRPRCAAALGHGDHHQGRRRGRRDLTASTPLSTARAIESVPGMSRLWSAAVSTERAGPRRCEPGSGPAGSRSRRCA